MAKANAQGRKDDSKHVRLYRYQWPALLERLDGNAFKALFYMLTFEDGSNNGAIFMGARTLADGIHVSKRTALRCLQHLDRQGFIRPEQLGYFTQKGGPATRWRITFLPANGKGPTNEWRLPAHEQKSWVQKLNDAGAESDPTPAISHAAGAESDPVEAEFREPAGAESSTQSIASRDSNPVELIRTAVSDWWRTAAPKARQQLAKQHGLQVGDLLDFVCGGDNLPFPKLVAIKTTIAPSRAAA